MTPPRNLPGLSELGDVMQIAYVPSNVPAAYDFWTRIMGVGPFFHMPHLRFADLSVRGHPSDAVISAGIAYWGDLQVEIIEVHDDSPSVYREWRDAGHEGIHHLCITVSDLSAARARIVELGHSVVQEMSLGKSGKVLFVDTHGGPGTMLEVLQMPEGTPAMFDRWRAVARNWDGREPIRPASRKG